MLVLGWLKGAGQETADTTIQRLFEEAQEKIGDSLWDEAIHHYREVIRLSEEYSEPYNKATYNIGYVYLMAGREKEAAEVFTEILRGDFPEMDAGGRGSGIMQEPYALYKHNACECLAEIEMRKGRYPAALEYIRLFDKKYPYRHFCGNELMEERIYTAQMYSRAYCGMGDTVKAIRTMLPYVLGNGLASNTALVAEAIRLLEGRYGRKALAVMLDSAIDRLQARTIGRGKDSYIRYEIVFLGVPIQVSELPLDVKYPENFAQLPEAEKMKVTARYSEFYSKIHAG